MAKKNNTSAWSDLEGHELLKPPATIRGTDQARLMARVQAVAPDAANEADEVDLDLEGFADLVDWMSEKFSVDPEAFDEWTSGEGGIERTFTLASAYAEAVGKLNSSENSSTSNRS